MTSVCGTFRGEPGNAQGARQERRGHEDCCLRMKALKAT